MCAKNLSLLFHKSVYQSWMMRYSTHLQMDLGSNLDPVQVSLLSESCVAVDPQDRVIDNISKKEAHLLGPNGQLPPLHRAFSVFLFNSDNQLLLQQRAKSKITFPNQFTNTCCSHPSYTPLELVEANHEGIKRAARRRLEAELGISSSSIELSDFHVLTRILYGAPSDSKWGEHEIDYILFLKKDVALNINPNEVSTVNYVSLDEFQQFVDELETRGVKLTPWFHLIVKYHLMDWWKQINDIENIPYDPKIHNLSL